ncbi:uncharacterized protein BCR38DRAFT_333406 [Pseudomassariella vexata]|uniref:Uncharacterized protein n=1 Tax=Pseudomassariella vexata TaxID=1141098 RepID=A0A1Y2EF87_9PEZI|nr:uncharacterized protein BCR38DRAFT_333406 [Pseudomassariella vexata]ORY69974.1 hypothetical protein BCR38DRAFT_333406 [Pseudomassariella vexata]
MKGLESNPTAYATLSLHESDLIRFTYFPEDIYQKAESVLRNSWPPGIKKETFYAGSYQYKLKGRPWNPHRQAESVGSRRLLRDILDFLYRCGWVLTTSINLSERVGKRDTMLFKKKLFEPLPPPAKFLAVQLSKQNKLLLHSDDADLIEGFSTVIDNLACFDKAYWSHDAFMFTTKGKPWWASREQSMQVKNIIMGIMNFLESRGWKCYGTVRHQTESADRKHCDSWYFMKPQQGVEELLAGLDDHPVVDRLHLLD